MELLKLIIFSICLFLFSSFLEAILFYLFLTITYKSKINNANNLDIITIFINILNIIMHLIIFQLYNFVNIINKTRYGSLVILSYNYLNSKVIEVKNYIFNWLVLTPLKSIIKLIIGKTVGNLNYDIMKIMKEMNSNSINIQQISTNKKTKVFSEIKLETNDDISNFLKKILDENNKSN